MTPSMVDTHKEGSNYYVEKGARTWRRTRTEEEMPVAGGHVERMESALKI